ncbi:helix-turn-helix domain-containing protein [Nonomuraea sp. NN258]|uniref:helix-turn-helix domain-containing protein n=1 Tax=Nonomuraea antri TaxID=2730852 RepID=UPI00156A47A8|nr:helix-turn-helix transcriptional regulator [Nonomuraea antri]NRQ37982.1 helix-turn-helix domain-containing protein [Nonomuraea antri]
MGQRPRDLEAHLSARHFFGAELRHWRERRELSQDRLGHLLHVSGDEIAKVEKAARWPTPSLAAACDQALDTDGIFGRLIPLVQHERGRIGRANSDQDLFGIASGAQNITPEWRRLSIPGGRAFSGGTLPIRVEAGRTSSGDVCVSTGDPSAARLIAIPNAPDDLLLLADARSRAPIGGHTMRVPSAYRLDEFTAAIIWAVTNLDFALLDDDGLLSEAKRRLDEYKFLSRSAVSHDAARGLSMVSRMWLGSRFCAQHILRNLGAGVPLFWSREQRGEDACTWLLFTHKLTYLRQTVAGHTTGVTRSFCIPQQAVDDSPAHERILLFLTAALMEALGIGVQVCGEPDYTQVDGFALQPGKRAIIATWVGGEGLWYVDVTPQRPVLRQFTDVCAYAQAHSILGEMNPQERLITFAEYLRLDWKWLVRRCSELRQEGTAGLITPRSRFLSTTALDISCAYLAGLRDPAAAR